MEVIFKPIGVIHSPFNQLADMPIQPISEISKPGYLEVFPTFIEGLKDLAGFSHIYLLNYLHKIRETKLTVMPFLDSEPRGVFATRAPSRPNPIGLSLVELNHIDHNLVYVNQLDVLNGTPLLDVKPYIPEFEESKNVRIGWVERAKKDFPTCKSDARFL